MAGEVQVRGGAGPISPRPGLCHHVAEPGTEVSRPVSRCQCAALPVIRLSGSGTAASNTAIRSRCRRHSSA